MIVTLLLAQIIINSYQFGTTAPSGGAGFIMQEDGTSFLMQQLAGSKLKKEFTSGGNLMQADATSFLMQQDSTSKLQQQ